MSVHNLAELVRLHEAANVVLSDFIKAESARGLHEPVVVFSMLVQTLTYADQGLGDPEAFAKLLAAAVQTATDGAVYVMSAPSVAEMH